MSREDESPDIAARKNVAGRMGFVMGCIAAVIALSINLYRAPRPLSFGLVLLSTLIAALNIPLGIALALLVERLTRRSSD